MRPRSRPEDARHLSERNHLPRLAVIAGMPRSGTTSLFHMLAGHPNIFVPYRKEVGFFLFNHHRGFGWLRRVYDGMRPDQIGLDVTPEYFFSSLAAARIRRLRPPAKVILGVRDPVECALSLYGEYAKRYHMPPLASFLQGYAYRRGGSMIRFALARGAIGRSLAMYRERFGADLLLYDYRMLAAEPLRLLQALEDFLGLPRKFGPETFRNLRLNAGDRSNFRPLTYVLSSEPVVFALGELLPRRLLVALARQSYLRKVRAAEPKSAEAPFHDPPAALLSDRESARDLFTQGGIVLGTGCPLPPRELIAP